MANAIDWDELGRAERLWNRAAYLARVEGGLVEAEKLMSEAVDIYRCVPKIASDFGVALRMLERLRWRLEQGER